MIRKNRFTIIELLIVIAVIAILAGMLFAAMGAITERKDKAATQALLLTIDQGLSKYFDDKGEYPEASGSAYDSKTLYKALVEDNSYVDVSDEFIKDKAFVDKWGNGIYYVPAEAYPASASVPQETGTGAVELALREGGTSGKVFLNRTSFQLRSLGKNGYDDKGSGDDISNVQN